ncbi:hypothetical protein M4I21_15790 [Cellulophaga sp. 20_2_10]|uniref:hypothetical protein n=1 Tax=Cellulophaga sp. 20_2_10 TaxID=2942476 RepID=UPI00201B0080|nr:hypothetical protein [Cellulophaga sp. 20_2_10]MCL5247284.1 hypothetical protein [Cellulophaga sp. 20_2_10]
MNSLDHILIKLRAFTKRYYAKTLLKGFLLFLSFGLLTFLVILGLEYLLWFNSTGRLILFLCLILVTVYLLYTYIVTPIFYLFQLRKGITNKEASLLIGKHFPEVGDKLYNLLDLADDPNKSELLLASIVQRSNAMDTIPFVKAINLKDNFKYLKYLAIPVLLMVFIWLSGNLSSFFGSYDRVVNYQMAFEQPAPFSFFLNNSELTVLKGESITLQLSTKGEVKPENVAIIIDDKELFLQENNGFFEYTVTAPSKNVSFYFKANNVTSKEYNLEVLAVPLLEDFSLKLTYPNYLNRKPEVLKSTGNATFPEGTNVSWTIKGEHISTISLETKDTTVLFSKADGSYQLSKKVYNNLDYTIGTSNRNVTNFEKLAYRFTVLKDANPTINVTQVKDSLNPNVLYYAGNASDDNKLISIKLVCYPENNSNNKQSITLNVPKSNVAQFYYTFPSGLNLESNTNYNFYFVATDNDAIHNGKSIKSQVFSTVLLDDNALKNNDLKQQQQLLDNLDNSLEKFKEQKEKLDDLNTKQKEKSVLNYTEQSEVKDYLQKQVQQEQMMEKFSKQLKENLDKNNTDDKQNKLLQERLERQEKEAKKNQKLLEELNKVADKINKSELTKRLEELAKSQKNSERNLEQLLELTKKYYVTEKLAQLSQDLEKLAKEQEVLADKKQDKTKEREEQEKLNKDFDAFTKELEELKKDNKKLQKPLDINSDKTKEDDVKQDQNDALDELNKEKGSDNSSKSDSKPGNKAAKKQKSAAEKMKQMSEKMQQSAAGGGGDSITEDAEMLRQILENLVIFSFKQEQLYQDISSRDEEVSKFSTTIKRQKELRTMFEHVDDSIFALSLRQAEISEKVNKDITEVYYNLDKSLEQLAENRSFLATANQKYVLNASNSLADFLANLLDNMNQSMKSGAGKGQGKGQGFQLPDIIKAQNSLKKKMGEPKSSEGKKPGEGKKGSEGKPGAKGEKGKSGEQGKEGEGGKKGESGENGEGGKAGSKGSTGENGEGKGGQPGGQSEEELQEIFEIYKQQQTIRQELEKQLNDMIAKEDQDLAKKLLQQMEDFENDLLENGITNRTQDKANNIQHQLLKLENASLKQGEKSTREANRAKNKFKNPITTKPEALENYRNEIEILNRQALPLQQIFQNKVQRYFKAND